MIRQLRNVACPALGTVADQLNGPIYAWRVAPPSGLFGLPANPVDRIWVTSTQKDGADELPVLVDPYATGWQRVERPLDGIRLNAFGAVAAACDLWYATRPGDVLPELHPRNAPIVLVSGLVAPGGAALDTGSLFTGPAARLTLLASNGAGAARAIVATWQNPDSSQLWTTTIIAALGASSSAIVHLGDVNIAGTLGGAIYNIQTPPRIRIASVAAGAADLTVFLWGVP